MDIFFSTVLLVKQFETTRRLIAYIPAAIGSLLICSTGVLLLKNAQVLQLTFPGYTFTPFTVRIDSTHALILMCIGSIGMLALVSLLGLVYRGRVLFSTALLGVFYNTSILLLVLVDTILW